MTTEKEPLGPLFRQTLDNLGDAVFLLDQQWRFIYLNAAACERLPFADADTLGKNIWELAPQLIGTKLEAAYKRAMSEHTTVDLEEYFPQLDEWYEIHAYPSDGHLAVFFRDITARKRAEHALRESETRFRQLTENISEVFYIVDPHTLEAVYVSPAFEALFGRPYRPGIFREVVHPDDLPKVEASRAAITQGNPREIEFRVCRPDGEECWVLDRSFPVCENGKLVRVVGIAEDITAERRYQQRQQFMMEAARVLGSSLDMHETLQRLAGLAVPYMADWCAIYLPDENGRLTIAAVAHTDKEKVALAHDVEKRFPPNPDSTTGPTGVFKSGQPEYVREITDEMLDQGLPNEEHRAVIRNLGLKSVITVPLRVRDRNVGAMAIISAESQRLYKPDDVVFAQDLANRAGIAVENARLFEESQKQANEVRKVMEGHTRLVRGFAHDLKNPIGAADGHAALLQDGLLGELNEAQQKSVNRVRDGLKAAVQLINDVVELARAEAGQLILKKRPIDVRTIVKEIVEQYRAAAENAGLSIAADLGEVPEIESDPDRVRQILGNLVSNAVKYTKPGGSIQVRTGLGDTCVTIDVVDTGIGIPEDKLDVLFTEFERIDPTVKPGAGLGLAISRRMAAALGGSLTVKTKRGEGSVFTLSLPAGNN